MSSYETDPGKGLSSREIPLKKKLFGVNQLEQSQEISAIAIFLSQFKDFMILVLLGAAFISAYLGEVIDAMAIAAIVILNGMFGFIQEYRTERSLQALHQLSAPTATVLRDGKVLTIPARDIVPGDIALLESGDRIPADGILLEAENLKVDESLLTGESLPVEKMTVTTKESQIKIHSQKHAFMGTLVVTGRGKMIVEKTGMDTEMGKIAGMIGDIEDEQTPLQKRLELLGKQLVILCLAICAIVALLGVVRGETIYDMFLFGVSLAVAAIPEGLPAIVTVVLTLGVQRMIRKKAIIRRLSAVETLGCATVICSDKTGTLTENRMCVRKIHTGGETIIITGTGYKIEGEFLAQDGKLLKNLPIEVKELMKIGVSCNNARINREVNNIFGAIIGNKELVPYGDPTEIAILVAGLKAKIVKEDIDKNYERIREIPFDSDRKRMSVIVKSRRGEIFLFTKGAPEVLLSLCENLEDKGQIRPITKKDEKNIRAINENMGKEALRVLGFAYKKLSITELQDLNFEKDLTFLGMMGIIDPPRSEAILAIQKCFSSGIRPVMITGDHKSTAQAVAQELGMLTKDSKIITGHDIDNMSESELFKQIDDDIAVFARVTPRHKLKIVKALKKKGHIVAMTGDGVNDAPAVKEADIGVSMGLSGTDVTKEASAMILMDDNFASIVSAVEEGRIIYDNIRKFIRYLLSCNVGEILTMIWTSALGLQLPLLPIQILWVNLVTDGLPAMALGIDPPEKNVMNRKPRGKNENVFSQGLGSKIIYRGVIISLVTLAAFIIVNLYSQNNIAMARTVAFATLVMSQLLFVFECRTEKMGVRWRNPFGNIYLTLAVIISAGMLFAVIYIPLLQPIFQTVPLNKNLLILVLGLAGLGAVI